MGVAGRQGGGWGGGRRRHSRSPPQRRPPRPPIGVLWEVGGRDSGPRRPAVATALLLPVTATRPPMARRQRERPPGAFAGWSPAHTGGVEPAPSGARWAVESSHGARLGPTPPHPPPRGGGTPGGQEEGGNHRGHGWRGPLEGGGGGGVGAASSEGQGSDREENAGTPMHLPETFTQPLPLPGSLPETQAVGAPYHGRRASRPRSLQRSRRRPSTPPPTSPPSPLAALCTATPLTAHERADPGGNVAAASPPAHPRLLDQSLPRCAQVLQPLAGDEQRQLLPVSPRRDGVRA